MKDSIKIVLAKLGLDVHNRGVLTVARNLRNAGMEVIYIGNSTPEQIIKTAIQEDADVLGVSTLGGAHLSLGAKLIDSAKKEGMGRDKVYIIGGAIPDDDIKKLNEIGFDAIFTSGATKEEIESDIKKLVREKSN